MNKPAKKMNDTISLETFTIELTPETCLGYNYPYRRKKVMAHICNKCYNPEKGYDMNYFDKMKGK
jgi:hypothetical protein